MFLTLYSYFRTIILSFISWRIWNRFILMSFTPCSGPLGVRFFICWAYCLLFIGLAFLRCLTVISSPFPESFYVHVHLGLRWPLVRWLSWPIYLWCLRYSCWGGYSHWPLTSRCGSWVNSSTVAEMLPEWQLKPHKAVFPSNCDLGLLLGLHVCFILYLGVIHIFQVHWESPFWFHSAAMR